VIMPESAISHAVLMVGTPRVTAARVRISPDHRTALVVPPSD
jgi:hypothetical protein